MVTSDFRPEVEIWPFRACAVKIRNVTLIMHYQNSSVVVDLLLDRYHVPQNVFLVIIILLVIIIIVDIVLVICVLNLAA